MKYGSLKDAGPAVPGAVDDAPMVIKNGPPGPVGRTFPVAKDSPEMSIIRQNALTNAREVVMANQVVQISGGTKAERQQALDSIAEDVLYLAYKFTDFSSGQREVARAAEQSRLNPPSV